MESYLGTLTYFPHCKIHIYLQIDMCNSIYDAYEYTYFRLVPKYVFC